MYQRIVIYTRLFRERWSNKCILSSLWDGPVPVTRPATLPWAAPSVQMPSFLL